MKTTKKAAKKSQKKKRTKNTIKNDEKPLKKLNKVPKIHQKKVTKNKNRQKTVDIQKGD